MEESLKKELVDFVLKRIPVKVFNVRLKAYSVQSFYSYYKRELMSSYPDLMPTDLRYSVSMSEAFEEYKVNEIRLRELDQLMVKKRNLAVNRSIPSVRRRKYKREYNNLVNEYNKLLEPQQRLIRRYKKLRKQKSTMKED